MKGKHIFILIYILILLLVPGFIIFSSYNSYSIKITNNIKPLISEKIGVNSTSNTEIAEIDNNFSVSANTDSLNITKNEFDLETISGSLVPSINVAEAEYSDVLETQVGKLTSYGPDCPGCSGRVGWGQNVTGGNIYYNDATYGQLRIVAGDKKYPYGTVVRISNSRAGGIITAIVLDRGGSVGIGKATMFDLLFSSSSEASQFGTSNNCTFEILRYGF